MYIGSNLQGILWAIFAFNFLLSMLIANYSERTRRMGYYKAFFLSMFTGPVIALLIIHLVKPTLVVSEAGLPNVYVNKNGIGYFTALQVPKQSDYENKDDFNREFNRVCDWCNGLGFSSRGGYNIDFVNSHLDRVTAYEGDWIVKGETRFGKWSNEDFDKEFTKGSVLEYSPL